ncbi:MAG TPA: DnaA/Hda family protein [Longimicrobiales bacterium]
MSSAMAQIGLESRFTFDAYVIGAANRLACAAARRVAESPGATYNPFFVYSASGLGKTHLVTAIGNHARRVHPELRVVYDTLEHFMEGVTAAIEAGDRDAFRSRLDEIDLLLLDDVQFLAGRHRTQEELLRAWDTLSSRGGQVVLTSDRPPQEIDGLDERLLSRFSGGLIVDIAAPDYETRVAIVRRKAAEREQPLEEGVAEALARIAFANVRELQGALNRLVAVQELEGRAVTADEVPALLGLEGARRDAPEFNAFLAEISDTVDAVVSQSPVERQIADAILRWEGEGYRTRRLEDALRAPGDEEEVEALIRGYEADVERLREIALEIDSLDPGAAERNRRDLLRDPDRRDDAEALLAAVRERMRPLPAPPAGHSVENLRLPADSLAVRAALAVAEAPGARYNPFFIHGPPGSGKTALLAALGHRLLGAHPDRPLAYVEGRAFVEELIEALERNQADGWRLRYRRARALLVDDLDALADTERAQEELFHLFDFLYRSGAQLAFAASRPPQELRGLEERLRTRLESGLVVELPAGGGAEERSDAAAKPRGKGAAASPRAAGKASADEGGRGGSSAGAASAMTRARVEELRSRENVVWHWPYVEDWLVEEPE